MVESPEIVCVGLACVDVLLRGADFARPFEGESRRAERVALGIGGDALNEASVLTKLGHRVRLVCGVGDDAAGLYLRTMLARRGVDTSALAEGQGDTLVNVIFIAPDGQRNFVHSDLPQSCRYAVEESLLHGAKAVCFGSLMAAPFDDPAEAERVATAAKQAGALLFADCVHAGPGTPPLAAFAGTLRRLDYVLPNEEEALALTNTQNCADAAQALLALGVGTVVIKRGACGCYVKNAAGEWAVPAYRVPAIDTTGAGDNFVAGVVHGVLAGLAPPQAARFGCGVAAVSVQVVGASEGVQSLAQVEEAIGRFG